MATVQPGACLLTVRARKQQEAEFFLGGCLCIHRHEYFQIISDDKCDPTMSNFSLYFQTPFTSSALHVLKSGLQPPLHCRREQQIPSAHQSGAAGLLNQQPSRPAAARILCNVLTRLQAAAASDLLGNELSISRRSLEMYRPGNPVTVQYFPLFA